MLRAVSPDHMGTAEPLGMRHLRRDSERSATTLAASRFVLASCRPQGHEDPTDYSLLYQLLIVHLQYGGAS